MHRTREQRAVSDFFQSMCVQWFKMKRYSAERSLDVNLTRGTDLAKVCNVYPCQKVKFQKSMKSTILYTESKATYILGQLCFDTHVHTVTPGPF